MSPRKKTIADYTEAITDDEGRLRYAPKTQGEWDALNLSDDPPDFGDLNSTVTEDHTFTINQIVASNVQRARKARGWSQEQLGSALTRLTNRAWSAASVSAAESSWKGGRVRRFDANELVAFSLIFKLPVAHFLLPPTDEEFSGSTYVVEALDEIGLPTVTRESLVRAIWDVDLPPEFFDRLKYELKTASMEWSEGTHSLTLKLDDDMLPRLLRALENVAGLDIPTDSEEILFGEDRS